MFCKVIAVFAIIALAQAKPTGKSVGFEVPPKSDIRDEDLDSRPSARYVKYSPPAQNDAQSQELAGYDEPQLYKNYAGPRANIEDLNGHDDEYYNGHPKYKYTYSVNDENTGDYKSHFEERDGDAVRGEYVVADPDGTIRKVIYSADNKNGFQAVVKTIKPKTPIHQNENGNGYNAKDAENGYDKYYQQKPVYAEADYDKYSQQKQKVNYAENDYDRFNQQKPKVNYAESDYDRFNQQKPKVNYAESDYDRFNQQKPKVSYSESDYDKYSQQKPVPTKVSYEESKYYAQNPVEVSHSRPLESNQDDYKSYVRPTIPTVTNFKPYVKPESNYKQILKPAEFNNQQYIKPAEFNNQQYIKPTEFNNQQYIKPAEFNNQQYIKPAEFNNHQYLKPAENNNKQYLKPVEFNNHQYIKPAEFNNKQHLKPLVQPRHHNLVSELKYQDRLNNHRLSGPGFDSSEELNLNYKHGKAQEVSAARFNGGYSFRPKTQKDLNGAGSEIVQTYAVPEFEDGADRYYEQ